MIGSVETAKDTFRKFADHTLDHGHGQPIAYRNWERNRTVLYCSLCHEEWSFKDTAMRELPYLLDYFLGCGLKNLIDPILDYKPVRGAWGKVLLGFLDESDEV